MLGAPSRPVRTPSRRREPGPLSERAANERQVAQQRLDARLSARGLDAHDPSVCVQLPDARRDCQFVAVMLALQHPLRPGSMISINPGRQPDITAQAVKNKRSQVRKWMIQHYQNLHKNSAIDVSWFTYFGVSDVDCINKKTWTERASQYAPAVGRGEWDSRHLGDRLSLFALAHIHKCNILLHSHTQDRAEKIRPIFGGLYPEVEIHIGHYQIPQLGHFVFALPSQAVGMGRAPMAAPAVGAAGAAAPAPGSDNGGAATGAASESGGAAEGGAVGAAAPNESAGAGGAAASPAPPALASAVAMHPAARQLFQERVNTMQELLDQGRIEQHEQDLMRNRMHAYYASQPDVQVQILRANDPYQYVGQKVREPFRMGGGLMEDYEGIIIGYGPCETAFIGGTLRHSKRRVCLQAR